MRRMIMGLCMWLAGAVMAPAVVHGTGAGAPPVVPAGPKPASLTKARPFKVVAAAPERVKAGDTFQLRYTVYLLDDTHYLYKDACSVTVTDPGPFTFGPTKFWPAPETTLDPFENKKKEVYHHPVTMYLQGEVPAGTPSGKYVLTAVVAYRGCNKTVCFFPAKETLVLEVEVAPPGNRRAE